jgi:hypothetical protein
MVNIDEKSKDLIVSRSKKSKDLIVSRSKKAEGLIMTSKTGYSIHYFFRIARIDNVFGLTWCGFMVFNATFNNISVISWLSVLLVEETGVLGENHKPVASH